MALLSVDHVSHSFGGLKALDDICFTTVFGDITALIGPNGAGKTTLFNCITGFYTPEAGHLVFAQSGHSRDEDIAKLTRSRQRFIHPSRDGIFLLERMNETAIARRAKIARTFQNIRLFPGMTALENLLVAQHNALMAASGWTIFSLLGLGPYRKQEKATIELAKYWLDLIGLYERADDAAGTLPYGDQRRLEIARAMMTDPLLLCLDEPAAGLNGQESQGLNRLIRKIRDEHGTSILLIEHDMSVVMNVSDHVIVLDYGRKIADGTPEEIRKNEAVIAAYLGVEEKVQGEAAL